MKWASILAVAALLAAPAAALANSPDQAPAAQNRSVMKSIEPGFAVAPQLKVEDVAGLAAAGVKTIINNRPDNEERGQPTGAAIEAAARAHGIDYVALPVVSGKLEDRDAAAFAAALDKAQGNGPVLAFCRSGSRTTALWALSQAGKRPLDELIGKAKAIGYDLAPLRARLQSRAGLQ